MVTDTDKNEKSDGHEDCDGRQYKAEDQTWKDILNPYNNQTHFLP